MRFEDLAQLVVVVASALIEGEEGEEGRRCSEKEG
jgi:hypothetical protein